MPFIVAIDYDGTLCSGSVGQKGNINLEVIEKAKEFKNANAEIILWTCREAGVLQEAIDRCAEHGLLFDAINSNSPSQTRYMAEMVKKGQVLATRKIFADIYVDDRSPGSIEYFLSIDVEKTCESFKDR